MFGRSNVRIANSILEGNLPFTVDDQLWRTDLVMSFMFLGVKTFVSTNNVVFGNKCPMAKDSPNVIEADDMVLDFPRGACVGD